MPKEKRPATEQMLTEIAEMIEKIKNFEGTIKPLENPGLAQARLSVAKKLVEILDKMVIEPMERQFDMDALTKEALESPNVTPENKRLVKKATEVQQEAKILNSAMKTALAKSKPKKGKKNPKEGVATSEQIKERRKLFKSIGGDKKWIPM